MKCRDVLCDSRSYLKDGQCHSKNVSNSSGSCITMFAKLSPSPDKVLRLNDVTNTVFQYDLQLKLRGLIKEVNNLLEEFTLFAKQTPTEMDHLYLILQMKFVVLDRKRTIVFSHLIDSFENKTLTIEMNDKNETFASNIVAYSLALFDDPSEWTNKTIRVPNGDILEHVQDNENVLVFPWLRLRCNVPFPFSKLHICPFIELNPAELKFEVINGFLLINESYLFKSLNAWAFKSGSSRLFLCVTDYKTIYDAMPERITESNKFELGEGAKDKLSLVCVCLSIVCLLVTIVTYSAFTDLHSQPGINTITLCVTLLLAQTIYQFGAGQTDGPKWSCVVIGAVCHFLWLSVMFAMNVCSFDMFRIFKNIQKLSTDFRWKDIIKRLSYICVGSVLFVAINFIVSLLLSDGKDIGYGGVICYLSSTRLHLITFIIPSLFTIITNFALFGFVVFKIGQSRVQAAKLGHERNYFGIYARLSTLSGLTWLIGYLSLLIKSDVLEYQFILLNAGQGVFIMLAFVCNRRVYRLIKDKLTMRIGGNNTQHTQPG